MGQRDFRFAFDRELSDDAEKAKSYSTSACMEALMDDRTKLDLFCIATFCVVDEVYLSSAVIGPIRTRRNVRKGLSDIERITMVLVGEAHGQRQATML